jgi:hypothetical protein
MAAVSELQTVHAAANGNNFSIRASKSVKMENGSGTSSLEKLNSGRWIRLRIPAGGQNRRSTDYQNCPKPRPMMGIMWRRRRFRVSSGCQAADVPPAPQRQTPQRKSYVVRHIRSPRLTMPSRTRVRPS